MKKSYTRKQISEAIQYWKKQLRRLNESEGTYLNGKVAFAYGPTGEDIEEEVGGNESIDNLLKTAAKYNHDFVILANNNDGTFMAYGCNGVSELLKVAQDIVEES